MIRRKKWAVLNKKKYELDGNKFQSKEEMEVYQWLKDWVLHEVTWIKEFKGAKLLDARPKAFRLFDKFTAGKEKVLARRYTSDFIVSLADWTEIVLEYKSKFTEQKSDYRLRRSLFLFFYRDKVNFTELIKIKKWDYILKKYYD